MALKSFFDLDYIIEINEKRIEEYIAAYQKVLEMNTNIILIYSAIAIFLVPIFQDIFRGEIQYWLFIVCFILFVLLFSCSLYFTVRLIIPVEVAYLSRPRQYYEGLLAQYQKNINPNEENKKEKIEFLLKSSYIMELQAAVDLNVAAFSRKRSFYCSALTYGLLSTVPYLVCLGFHIAKKEEKMQKLQLKHANDSSEMHKIDAVMFKNILKKRSKGRETIDNRTAYRMTTTIPGVDMSEVIPASPYVIKENSYKIKNIWDIKPPSLVYPPLFPDRDRYSQGSHKRAHGLSGLHKIVTVIFGNIFGKKSKDKEVIDNRAAYPKPQIPGVDMSQVIPASPYVIKENSYKIKNIWDIKQK